MTVTEKTVEREADTVEQTAGVAVDGEDEVVDYLRDVSSAADRWDADFEAEDVGRVVGGEIRQRDADEESLLYPEAFETAHDAVQDVGAAAGADGDWTVPERRLVLEVELPDGDTFEESFHLPHATDDARIFQLCDALGVVPGAGESLAGEAVPVETDDGEWRVVIPEPVSASDTESTAPETETDNDSTRESTTTGRQYGSPVPLVAGLALVLAGVAMNNGYPVFFGLCALAISVIDGILLVMDE